MTDANAVGSVPTEGGMPRRVWSVTTDAPSASAPPATAAPAFPAPAFSAPLASPPPVVPVTAPAAFPPPTGAAIDVAPVQSAIAAPPPAGGRLDAPPPAGTTVAAAPPPVVPTGRVMEGIHPLLLSALDELVARSGSDLHVAAESAPMVRVDGELRAAGGGAVWSREHVSEILGSILNPRQRASFEQEWELDFAISPRGEARFRVNFYRDRDAMAAAFRLIPSEIKSLKQLGVPSVVSKFAGLPRGLVLVTGPTGSGKSTTLAALIDLVNKSRADHIVTIEDPIEFVHSNQRSLVNQREVGADTHSFGDALKRVLRQDPDVILIGELRDLETVSTALTAAETGHLVFATLHTQSAAQTIDRIIDVFPPHQQGQVRSQLALTLQGVVCQTLLPRATGQGRIIATEVMVTTPAIANLIREGKTYQITSALQAGREAGMHTMDQHLADLVNSHLVTHEVAASKMQDPENFNRLVHRQSPTGMASSPDMAGRF